MRHATRRLLAAALAAVFVWNAAPAPGQVTPTSFTYQGRIKSGLVPATGPVTLRCSLWVHPTYTNELNFRVGNPQTLSDLPLSDGVFSATLDFGGIPMPDANGLWLQLEVESPHGSGTFLTISPRQPFLPPPVAHYSFATRGVTVDNAGHIGIGSPPPQYAIQLGGGGGEFGVGPTNSTIGLASPASGGNGPEAGSVFVAGGDGGIGTARVNGGPLTLQAGRGSNGVEGGSGGTVRILAGNAGNGAYPGNGGDVVIRPGAPSTGTVPGSVGTSGEIRAEGRFVVDLSGPSSMKIGKSNTSINGNTTLLMGTSAATNGHCYIQGIGSAGSNFGELVLNPDGGTVSKPGGGSFALYSDARLKTDIRPLTGTLDKLLQLRGHTFRYTDEARSTRPTLAGKQTGLIAQEVQQVFPDWIDTDADGFLMVTERSTTALMVESLRDLRNEKDAQLAQRDARLQALERENTDLKSRLDRLERTINK